MLRPQLPLQAVRYVTVFIRTQRKDKKHPEVVRVCSSLASEGSCSSVLSLCCHGVLGQEPATARRSSVDELWGSGRCSFRSRGLLHPGWYPVLVRHHPDSALLQNQDPTD